MTCICHLSNKCDLFDLVIISIIGISPRPTRYTGGRAWEVVLDGRVQSVFNHPAQHGMSGNDLILSITCTGVLLSLLPKAFIVSFRVKITAITISINILHAGNIKNAKWDQK